MMEGYEGQCPSRYDSQSLDHNQHSPPSTPPPSFNEDAPPGFGWEFQHVLAQKMNEKLHMEQGRMERYGRFGMEQAEARLPTPEHYRESYQELLAAAQTIDRTPSPLPESGELNKGPEKAQRAQRGRASKMNHKPENTHKKKQDGRRRANRISKRRISSHGMLTRSMVARRLSSG